MSFAASHSGGPLGGGATVVDGGGGTVTVEVALGFVEAVAVAVPLAGGFPVPMGFVGGT